MRLLQKAALACMALARLLLSTGKSGEPHAAHVGFVSDDWRKAGVVY